MSRIQITGSQIKNLTITNGNIADTTIAEAKLVDGAKYLRSDNARAWTVAQDAGTKKLTNLAAGVNPNDAVTYQQLVDNSAGLDPKQSVRAATTGAVTLSGEQTVDGVALVAGDRVLVMNQADAKTNGIYVVSATDWARAADQDGSPSSEVSGGNYTFVEQGTLNAGCGYVIVASGVVTLGTDNVVWTQFSGAGLLTTGNGLVKNGNVIDVQVTDGLYFAGAGSDFIGVKLDGTTLSVSTNGVKLADLSAGKVLIGSAENVATAQDLKGDVSVIADGTVTIGTGRVSNGMLAGSIAAGKLTVADGKVLIGGVGNVAAEQTVTGDVTISNAGVTAIGESKVTSAMLAGSIAVGKLTLADGKVLIGGSGNTAAEQTVSGDVTISNAGVTAIGSGKVTNDMLAGSIAEAKLADSGLFLRTDSARAWTVDQNAGTKKLTSLADGTNAADAVNKGQLDTKLDDSQLIAAASINWSSVGDSDIPSALAIKNYISSAASFIDEEVPTGDINGVNTAYTLANTPVATSVKVYLNGQRLKNGGGFDWTLSGTTLTLTYAPETSDVLVVEYRKSV